MNTRNARGLKRMRHALLITLALLVLLASPSAQPVFTGADIFPPDEFASRRAKVMERIGDGVAILQGTTERPGEQPFRQNNQFFYLTGVVEPRAIAIIDGRARRTTVFLQGLDERREQRMFGPGLHPGSAAEQATGIESVMERERFAATVADLAREPRVVYTPFRAEVLGESSSPDAAAAARMTKEDPWDARPSREESFVAKLRAAALQDIRDLDPILDGLRTIKSPREIEVIREATRITGLAIVEA